MALGLLLQPDQLADVQTALPDLKLVAADG